jgi:hypothetical protein
MKSLSITFLLLLCVFASAPAANASSITYTFTGAQDLSGTNFTYISPSGFLAFDTGILTPTTSTDLHLAGTDYGALTGFDFESSTVFDLFTSIAEVTVSGLPTYQIGSLSAGQNLVIANLAITNTPAATPEPSSLLLLATGALGIAALMRRRFLPS